MIITHADDAISRTKSSPIEEILFLLPTVSLMSSPSKCVKGLAADLLLVLEKLLVKMFVVPNDKPITEKGAHYLSTPGTILSRLVQHLWYQVPFFGCCLALFFPPLSILLLPTFI